MVQSTAQRRTTQVNNKTTITSLMDSSWLEKIKVRQETEQASHILERYHPQRCFSGLDCRVISPVPLPSTEVCEG